MNAGHRIDRDELLSRVDLEALLDDLCGPAGPGRRWHCPDRDHPDVHPSVTVTVGADRVQRWRCWSGDHRGTAIDAVTAAHRTDVGEAIRWLTQRYRTSPTIDRTPPPSPPPGQPKRSVVQYVQRAERLLWTPAGQPQRDWLTERGLGEAVLRLNRIGADPGRRWLPRPKGFPAGSPAVIYPALSPGGTVTYFQARYLQPSDGRPKYDNPARRHATNPRVAWLQPPAEPRPEVLVTEGIADGLVAAQAGYRTVSVLGSSYPHQQIVDAISTTKQRSSILRDVTTVVVCFDNDPAGNAGSDRLCRLLTEAQVPHRVVTPPDGLDLTAWAQITPTWHHRVAPPPAARATPAIPTGPSLGLAIEGPR